MCFSLFVNFEMGHYEWIVIWMTIVKFDNLNECYDFFSDIIKKNNTNSMAYNQLGNVLRLQNKNEESLISYKKAIEISKNAYDFAKQKYSLDFLADIEKLDYEKII